MASCSKYKVEETKICVGDMKHRIQILARAIQAPTLGGVDFGMGFVTFATVWSSINTKSSQLFSDGTNTEKLLSHEFGMRYLDGIDNEKVIFYRSEYYKVIGTLPIAEKKEFLLVYAVKRGPNDILVNQV